jgi:hypothetical protein
VVFPVITGSTGHDRVYDGYPDVALELVSSRLFDGRLRCSSTRRPCSPGHRRLTELGRRARGLRLQEADERIARTTRRRVLLFPRDCCTTPVGGETIGTSDAHRHRQALWAWLAGGDGFVLRHVPSETSFFNGLGMWVAGHGGRQRLRDDRRGEPVVEHVDRRASSGCSRSGPSSTA